MTDANHAYYRKLGDRVRLLRLDKRLTVEQLAVGTGLKEEQILRLQNGETYFNDKIVGLLAKALGVRKSEISKDFQDD